jgi:hypothetical protein
MDSPLYVQNGKRVTQVGSLPYQDVDAAIEYSLRHPIPFLPELPRRGDDIFNYIENPVKLSCLEGFKKNKFDTVKLQLVCPITLTKMHDYSKNVALGGVYEHAGSILDGMHAKEIIVFLDEPYAAQATGCEKLLRDTLDVLEVVREELKLPKIIYGIHCCDFAPMLWSYLFSNDIGIDIINFNASEYDITPYYKSRNKNIAWGIKREGNVKDWQTGDLLTLPCGMGGKNIEEGRPYTEDDCDKKLDLLLQVSRNLK